MKLSTHLSLQGVLFVLLTGLTKYGNELSGIVPAKAQPYLQLAIGLAMAGLGWYNHYFNPDGTAATLPYAPKP